MGDRSLTREVLKISWPMLISELSESLYSIADTYFVSSLGTTALAAVGVGSYLSWLFFVVVALFSTGVIVYVSQSYGAGELSKARRALGEAIVYGVLTTSLVAIVVHYNSSWLVSLIAGPNPGVVAVGASYLATRILGLPVLVAAVSMDSSLRAIGATKYSMVVVLSSTFLNIVLDPLFIFGLYGFPRMGVVGAAVATVISIVYMVPLELFFLKKTGIPPAITVNIRFLREGFIYRIVRIGAPTALERAVFAIGNNAYIAFIARCGEVALAAHQIGIRIESFIYMPGFAFSVAASALVGQRIGAGNIDEAKRIGWEAARIATIIMAVLGVFLAATSYYLVLPFSPTADVAQLASIYLILAGLSEPGLALVMTLSGGIRGGGNTLVPMMLNVTGLYLFRVLPAAFLVNIYGAVGAWTAMFIDVYLRGIIFLIVYRRFFRRLVKRVV
ncbi:MATE family efflux transporter [Desulfurococcaceae archaeon MEX13E-LK6-19]|nr:MATE family efflux transporter [Desulfurococcaceae archaeon MEX13E-LK6-19]